MDFQKLLAIVDKNVNQEALAKDLAVAFIIPAIEKAVEGVDIIPGTDIDQAVIKQVVEFLKAQVK